MDIEKFQVKVKHTKGQTQTAELDADPTVQDLKEAIVLLFNIPIPDQKIIYKGKILSEMSDKLKSKYNIKSGDLIMLIEQKKESPTENPKPIANQNQQTIINNPIPTLNQSEQQFVVDEEKVKLLGEMGYVREDIIPCQTASLNDTEVAIEFLLNGIPEDLEGDSQEDYADENIPIDGQVNIDPENNPLINFINSPQFEDIRQQAQNDPDVLNQLLANLQQNNPILHQVQTDNPQILQQLLGNQEDGSSKEEGDSDYEDEMDQEGGNINQLQHLMQGISGDLQNMNQQQNLVPNNQVHDDQILLTEDDEQTCMRLVGLGFEYHQCVEAFLACGRDENATANFLFDNPNFGN